MSNATKTIDDYLASLPAWQRKNLELFRKLAHETEPSIEEDWKWSVPFFMLNGKMFFAMSAFKAHTKYNFIANGAVLEDKNHLFNNGLESKTNRSIDLKEQDKINEGHLKALIKAATLQAK